MRRPNIAAASADLGFAVVAFIVGVVGAGWWAAALVAVLAAAVWAWLRRASLARMAGAQLATNVVVALGLLAVVLGGAYWLGTVVRGAG